MFKEYKPSCEECDSDIVNHTKIINKSHTFYDANMNEVKLSAELYILDPCDNCGHYLVNSIALNSWEKDIAFQIINNVSNPSSEMIKWVRHVFGISKDMVKWFVNNYYKED